MRNKETNITLEINERERVEIKLNRRKGEKNGKKENAKEEWNRNE
jgi:hypothetical protein